MPPEAPAEGEGKEEGPKITFTRGKLWFILILIFLLIFLGYNLIYNKNTGQSITPGNMFFPAYIKNMVNEFSSSISSVSTPSTPTTPTKETTTTTTKQKEPQSKFPTKRIIFAVVLIIAIAGWRWNKKRKEKAEEEPTQPRQPQTPHQPQQQPPSNVPPNKYGPVMDYITTTYANSILITGRALKTAVDQAVMFQNHKPTELESLGMLVGFPNPKAKKKGKDGVVIPFYIPIPALSADDGSCNIDPSVFGLVHDIAKKEFTSPSHPILKLLYDSLNTKIRSLRDGFQPNELLDLLAPNGLFDSSIRSQFAAMEYRFGKFQNKLGFIGDYHNHPMSTTYNAALLVNTSSADRNFNCYSQKKWPGVKTCDLLVATQVLDQDAMFKIGKDNLFFKFWHSDECRSDGTGQGEVEVDDYLIFCMDKEIYEWWVETAPRLHKQGKILAWYDVPELIKIIQEPEEETFSRDLNHIIERKQKVIDEITHVIGIKEELLQKIQKLAKEIGDRENIEEFLDEKSPFLRDPHSDIYKETDEQSEATLELIRSEVLLENLLKELYHIESELNLLLGRISETSPKPNPQFEEIITNLNELGQKITFALGTFFRESKKEKITELNFAKLLDKKHVERRVTRMWNWDKRKLEHGLELLLNHQGRSYNNLAQAIGQEIELISQLIELLQQTKPKQEPSAASTLGSAAELPPEPKTSEQLKQESKEFTAEVRDIMINEHDEVIGGRHLAMIEAHMWITARSTDQETKIFEEQYRQLQEESAQAIHNPAEYWFSQIDMFRISKLKDEGLDGAFYRLGTNHWVLLLKVSKDRLTIYDPQTGIRDVPRPDPLPPNLLDMPPEERNRNLTNLPMISLHTVEFYDLPKRMSLPAVISGENRDEMFNTLIEMDYELELPDEFQNLVLQEQDNAHDCGPLTLFAASKATLKAKQPEKRKKLKKGDYILDDHDILRQVRKIKWPKED